MDLTFSLAQSPRSKRSHVNCDHFLSSASTPTVYHCWRSLQHFRQFPAVRKSYLTVHRILACHVKSASERLASLLPISWGLGHCEMSSHSLPIHFGMVAIVPRSLPLWVRRGRLRRPSSLPPANSALTTLWLDTDKPPSFLS